MVFHFERIYRFEFLPSGLFVRIIVRLLSICRVKVIWCYGFIASFDNNNGQIFLENQFSEYQQASSTNQLQHNELLISVRGQQRNETETIFSFILEMIEDLTKDWPYLKYVRYVCLPTEYGSCNNAIFFNFHFIEIPQVVAYLYQN